MELFHIPKLPVVVHEEPVVEPEVEPPHVLGTRVGDKVMWNGIGPLTVNRITEEGHIYAHCLTMQLCVSGPEKFDKES